MSNLFIKNIIEKEVDQEIEKINQLIQQESLKEMKILQQELKK